jgi:hypothetical protein
VAVENALPSVKQEADLVTKADHGAAVEELIQHLLQDDLASRVSNLHSNGMLLGTTRAEPKQTVLLPTLGQSILVAGPSGSGKSTVITGLIERLAGAKYQFCLFDPEGDYDGFEPAINFGNPHYAPTPEEVLALLERMHSAVVNLLGVSLEARPAYVSEILRKLEDLRARKGRPHWTIVDEAHHIFPADWPAESVILPRPPQSSLMITVHPRHVKTEALAAMDIVIAVGKDPHETIREVCRSLNVKSQDLIQGVSDDLRRRAVTASSQHCFESLLPHNSPQGFSHSVIPSVYMTNPSPCSSWKVLEVN